MNLRDLKLRAGGEAISEGHRHLENTLRNIFISKVVLPVDYLSIRSHNSFHCITQQQISYKSGKVWSLYKKKTQTCLSAGKKLKNPLCGWVG